MAGLNQLAICPVVPWRVLLEQGAELSHRAFHHLAGVDPPFACVDGTGLFLVEYSVTHIDALVVVQKEDVADMGCRQCVVAIIAINGIGPGAASDIAFDDARSMLMYRYGGNYQTLPRLSDLFGVRGVEAFHLQRETGARERGPVESCAG